MLMAMEDSAGEEQQETYVPMPMNSPLLTEMIRIEDQEAVE